MTDQGSPTPEPPHAASGGSADGESALSRITGPTPTAGAAREPAVGSTPAGSGTDEVAPADAPTVGDAGPAAPGTLAADATQADATQTEQSHAAELAQSDLLHRTRASSGFLGLIIAAILLILLMIFIAQNSDKVTLHFLWFSGDVSLAVALVIATVVGILLVAIPGGLRMWQLRKRVKGLRNAVLKD